MSREDIVQYQFRSGDEAQENGRKGGIASGISRRRNRVMADMAVSAGKTKVTNKEKLKKLSEIS